MNHALVLQTLNLTHFRGHNHLELRNLSQVNVLVGANNSGKTSILEAIELLSMPQSVAGFIQLIARRARMDAARRKNNIANYMCSLFQEMKEEGQPHRYRIRLEATVNNKPYRYEAQGTIHETIDTTGTTRTSFQLGVHYVNGEKTEGHYTDKITNGILTHYKLGEERQFDAFYYPSGWDGYGLLTELLSKVILENKKDDILSIVQKFDGTITDISIVGDDIYIHRALSASLPLFAFGSGMQKAVFLSVVLMCCRNGIILIDEIDNAIHTSALEEIFRWFLQACKQWNVQAFITTHSAEALDAMLRIVHEDYEKEDLLRVITLRKNPKTNETVQKIRTGQEAYRDRDCYQMELRV